MEEESDMDDDDDDDQETPPNSAKLTPTQITKYENNDQGNTVENE